MHVGDRPGDSIRAGRKLPGHFEARCLGEDRGGGEEGDLEVHSVLKTEVVNS